MPLQVAHVDDVEVDNAERADAGGGEIHRRGRSQTARPDAQHLRRLELALPVHADFRQDQVPAVAPHFVLCQLREWGWLRRLDCARSLGAGADDVGAPPATDGMMLTVSPDLIGV